MIYVYISDSEAVSRKKSLKELVAEFKLSDRERAFRYKNTLDGINFALGRLLLKTYLSDSKSALNVEQMEYLPGGKPLLENLSFTISHSGGRVVCAVVSEGAIGIDIEKRRSPVLKNFKPWFTDKEWDEIQSDPHPLNTFYRYWTRKESIIKALGINLSDLHKIELDPAADFFRQDENLYYLYDLDIGDPYVGALCCQVENAEIQYVFPDFQ